MRRPRGRQLAAPGGHHPPRIEAPPGLNACELDAAGERFALLEWPISSSAIALTSGLTRAEAAVSTLAAAGLSNAEIAAARGAAGRTVANQLASAFRKLGVRSRAELCARLSTGRRPGGGRR